MSKETKELQKLDFLEFLSISGDVSTACEVAGTSIRGVKRWVEEDPDFGAAWKDAQQVANDTLEKEARRRAVKGVLEPVYQGGILVGYIRKFSDTLLKTLLAGNSKKFNTRVDLTHAGDAQNPVKFIMPTDESAEREVGD